MRQLAPKTRDAYIRAELHFTGFLSRPPDTATAEELRRYQLHCVDQGTSAITLKPTITGVNQQRSQVGVTAFADAKQTMLATRRALARHETQPRSKLAAIVERSRIGDTRHQPARRERADPRDRLQSQACRILAVPSIDFSLQFAH